MNSNNQETYLKEDEIDLRELFIKIWAKKIFIVSFTFIVTILAAAYTLTKTPIYEGKVLIEIGNYKLDNSNNNNSNNNSNILIDNANALVQKLNILFIDMKKNVKNKEVEITNISVPKKQDSFIEITANGINNDLIKKDILGIVKYISTSHKSILEDVKNRRELQINNINRKINNIKNNEIKLLEERVSLQNQTIEDLKSQLKIIDENLKKIEKINPTLAALKLMEKRDISNFILKISEDLMETKNKKDILNTTILSQLEEERNLIQSLLLPHNYKNTQIVGKILINDYAIKPKKTLIVIVSFITGLILAIFLVFLIDFIRGFKETEDKLNFK